MTSRVAFRSPSAFRLPPSAPRRVAPGGDEAPQVLVEHVARERGLARAGDARHHRQPAERHAEVQVLEVVQARRRRSASAGDAWLTGRRACSGCLSGCARKRPVTEAGTAHQVRGGARRDDLAAAAARAGAQVDHVRRAAYRLLVVLHHDQRVALRFQLLQRGEQDAVVARDGGRWWARRGCRTRRAGWSRAAPRAGCAAPRRPRAWAPRDRARDRTRPTSRRKARRLASSATMSRAISASRPSSRSSLKNFSMADTDIRDRSAIECSRNRTASAVRIQSIPVARSAGNRLPFVPVVPPDLLAALLLVEAGHREPGAVAARAPAVPRVVGEEPRVELGKARAARGARALHREHRLRHARERGVALGHRALERFQRRDDVHDALAVVERAAGAPRAAAASFSGAARTSATGSSMVCS